MYFLKSTDYDKIIQSDNLNQIINSNPQILLDAELFGLAEMNSYLTQLFDVDTAFQYFTEFNISNAYSDGNRVYVSGTNGNTYYYNISGTTQTGGSITDTDIWLEGDNRNPQLVTYLIDLVLYHVHTRLSPRQVPEIRIDRYNHTMNFLKNIFAKSACG